MIGLGGSGLAAVGEVLRRGLSVVGVDAGRVAAGAAGRNGGFLLGGPAIGVHQAAAGWGLELALQVYRQSLDEITALIELLGAGGDPPGRLDPAGRAARGRRWTMPRRLTANGNWLIATRSCR